MCGQCAMIAAGGASGARIAMAHYLGPWLTPKRLRRVSIALGCAAVIASTVTLGGTDGPVQVAKQSQPPATSAP
jgi:hypothetical protein